MVTSLPLTECSTSLAPLQDIINRPGDFRLPVELDPPEAAQHPENKPVAEAVLALYSIPIGHNQVIVHPYFEVRSDEPDEVQVACDAMRLAYDARVAPLKSQAGDLPAKEIGTRGIARRVIDVINEKPRVYYTAGRQPQPAKPFMLGGLVYFSAQENTTDYFTARKAALELEAGNGIAHVRSDGPGWQQPADPKAYEQSAMYQVVARFDGDSAGLRHFRDETLPRHVIAALFPEQGVMSELLELSLPVRPAEAPRLHLVSENMAAERAA